jgi:hypothetical protein
VSGKSKISPERIQAITQALRAGNTRRAAASYGEIDHSTMYRWMDEDATFRDAVEKAEADAEVRFVAQVASAATNGTWQAAAWWLERRRQQEWKKTDGLELSSPPTNPIIVKHEGDTGGSSLADTLAVLAEVGVIAPRGAEEEDRGGTHTQSD